MANKCDKAYLHKESNEVMKVERVNDNSVVVHYPTGPERVSTYDLGKDFESLGKWEDYEGGLLTSKEL